MSYTEHQRMMVVSDFYCVDCDEYFMSENMQVVREPHGEYLVHCPNGAGHEIKEEAG